MIIFDHYGFHRRIFYGPTVNCIGYIYFKSGMADQLFKHHQFAYSILQSIAGRPEEKVFGADLLFQE